MKTIDAKGQACPIPLIMTKKALSETGGGETLEILIDNETSAKNVTRFLEEHNMTLQTERQGNLFRIIVHKTGVIPEDTKIEPYCCVPQVSGTGYAIAFQKDTLGQGSDELGGLLIKAFINTLPDIDVKPTTLLFLNSGIFLTLKGSPVLEALSKLEAAGIKILVCGTCLDYFGKKPELEVGIVSNMYDILGVLSTASKVVYA